MKFEFNINIRHHEPDPTVTHLLKQLIELTINLNNKTLNTLMATMQELAQALDELTAQSEKAKGEILGKIAELETAVANSGNTSPEVDEKLAALKASVQGTDDIVPDAPVDNGGGDDTDIDGDFPSDDQGDPA